MQWQHCKCAAREKDVGGNSLKLLFYQYVVEIINDLTFR